MTESLKSKLIGRVQRVIQPDRSRKGYGFILTDDRKKLFFHQNEVVDQTLPPPGSIVRFSILEQTAPGKHDRAVNVEPITVPG